MKQVEKDISIVLPTWNRVKELKQTLPKLLSICNEKTEVIIIDNDSDDGTREYLMQVSETNHNIKLVFKGIFYKGLKFSFIDTRISSRAIGYYSAHGTCIIYGFL